MVLDRRSLLALGALTAPAIASRVARGQADLPDKPIRIFIGFEAGGGADTVARAIAARLQRRLGRRVSVESRTGSFGAVPGEIVRKGPADGSQLALLSSTTLVAKLATRDFPFDPVDDLAPVTEIGTFSVAFAISPLLAIESLADYIAWLKAGDARRRRIAVSSNAAFVEVFNLLLAQSTGETLEPVSYRGAVPMVNDLQEGRIPASVNTITSLLPAHRGGRCRILFLTARKRLAVAPAIPTAIELGYPKLDMEEWFAFFTSPTTSSTIVSAWNRELRAAIEDPDVAGELRPLGLEVATSSPDGLAARIDAHRRAWEARMKSAGLQPV
ncbi:Bug family tripartite tricarboxylate transporter substrate binding protein [Reyranella sp.]|jgi:tripartite-type tricarboxylate transporter receptor subunit TctC|uniref:Bug family tripartite tricarboxylate transporter substrate binding protein n=1 Tax=Reyranella sp. TaxID=1929291 RepID=UPI002F94EE67